MPWHAVKIRTEATDFCTTRHRTAYSAHEEVLTLMMKQPRSRGSTDSEPMHGTCTAVIGSMTLAMKAQSILSDAAIRASIAKISSSEARGGCAYGVDFPCTQSSNVQMILSRAGIRARQYIGM